MYFLPRWINSAWYHQVTQAAHTALNHLVHEPIRGTRELIIGLGLTIPDLTQGAVQAVASQLSIPARAKIVAGATLIASGVRRMIWPLALMSFIGLCGWIGILLAVAVVLFFLVTALMLVDHWQWRRQSCPQSAS